MTKTIMGIVLMGIVSAQGQTVLVRGKSVDLSPVVKWLETREGERPMAHWKEVEVREVLGKGWGGYRVSVNVDGKERKDSIVIQNIPATLLQVISADDATLKAMAETEARMEVLDRQRGQLERQKELTVRELNNAYEVTLAQIRENEEAMAELRTTYTRQAETLRYTSEAKKSKLLAYFTGQKMGPYEVWDCGVGSKVLGAEGVK